MLQAKATRGASFPGRRELWGLGLMAACAVLANLGHLSAAADGDKPAARQGEANAPPRTDLYGDRLPAGALARLGTLRWRHGASVSHVAFTPDGKSVLTASQDNVIRLWDLKTGKEIRRYEIRRPGNANVAAPPGGMMGPGWGRGGMGTSVALAPDGKTLAATTQYSTVQLWDVATGKELRSIPAGTGASALLFSPDGTLLAGRGFDQAMHLWEASTGKEVRQIQRVQNQPGGRVVIAGGFYGAANLAFSPDGKLLATPEVLFDNGQVKTTVMLWEVATGKEIRQIDAGMGGGVPVLAFAPDGKALAYASFNGIHLCSPETGKEIRQVGPQRFGTTALVFSPDGQTLAASTMTDRRIQLYSVATGKVARELGGETAAQGINQPFVGAFGGAASGGLAFSPDGKLVAAGAGSTVRFWAADTGKDAAKVSGHYGDITGLAVVPGDKLVASWAADNTVRLWDPDSGKERDKFAAPNGTVCAAFTPDARTVALGNSNGNVLLHDSASGKELHRLQGHQQGVGAVAFSPDGKTVASRGNLDDSIRLYETATGRELRVIGPPPPKNAGGAGQVFRVIGPGVGRVGLAFSPDGTLIASPRANMGIAQGGVPPGGMPMQTTLHLWRVSTGKEVQKIVLPTQYSLVSFAFAPDGRVLATENADQTITLWEVASGKERAHFGKPPAMRQPVNGQMMMVMMGGRFGGFGMPAAAPTFAFAPAGRTLAAAGPDRSIHLWDIATGKEVGALKGHEGSITALAFAPDGKTLTSGSSDTTLLIWDTARLNPAAKPVAVQLPAAEVETIWTDLAGPDGIKAYQGMQKLRTAPGQVVPLLRERLRPTVPVEAAKVRVLVADLGSKRFAQRQRASTALEKLGELAVPELTRTLGNGPPLETRLRIEQLLDKVTGGSLSNEQLRLVRAVEVLEMIGTPEARQILDTLSRGAPGALPTREAQAALDRLARRPSAQP
jgi:WD40 repeat protein